MSQEQEKVFWEIIDTFSSEGLLPYVMLIGSWAEYAYQDYLESGFKKILMTTDVDFLYKNLNRPTNRRIDITNALLERGFKYSQNRITGVTKFTREGILDLEFLVRVLGKGNPQHVKIPSLNIVGIGLRDVNMLASYQITVDIRGYAIILPEPEIYVLHKILISSKRLKEEKREKDLQSARELIPHIDKERMQMMFDKLFKKQQKAIEEACEKNYIRLWW